MFVPFDPLPSVASLPEVFPTPFRPGPPHPLAQRAALETQAVLGSLPWITPEMFNGALGGKMIGVLVVRDPAGRVGYLRAFAGMLGGRRLVEGFAPPIYDVAAFESLWGPGSETIAAFDAELAALRAGESSDSTDSTDPRGSADSEETLKQLRAITEAQRAWSRSLHAKLHATYEIPNARGEHKPLRELFGPLTPPGGSGDCAGVKLLARAFTLGLHPVALGEFWWGASPPAGGRQHAVFYPACRGRCAKILPFMLEGISCEAQPDVGILVIGESEPRVVYSDDAIVVVDKPAGLLSVPGRGPRRRDSVEARLQARCGLADPSWPRVAHRLDLATSGLIIAAKHKQAYVALQRQFSSRTVEKRYIAWVRGLVEAERGIIDLPLRRDLDDRPRQMHDAIDGKVAVTRWEVLARETDTTRVALFPKTGRTHQLRLHTAHPRGLDAPIVGDLLYGFGGERLMLHAESIQFSHPLTEEPMELHSPCPF